MENNTERYLETFNKFENALKLKLGKNRFTPFAHLIKEGARSDKFIKYYLNILESLSDLRNVLVHKEGNKIVAVPSDYAVGMLELIYDKYTKPTNLDKICNHNLVSLRSDITLDEALEIMKKYDYSKLPVYSKEKFEGMFTASSFTRWYLEKLGTGVDIEAELKSVRVSEVLKKTDVKFLARDMNVYEFVSLLEKNRSKSGIYIVTEHGKSTEKAIGIITSFDYKQIIDSINLNL